MLYSEKLAISKENWKEVILVFLFWVLLVMTVLGGYIHWLGSHWRPQCFSPPGSFQACVGKAASEGQHSPISLSSCLRPRISRDSCHHSHEENCQNAIFVLLCCVLGRDLRGESIKPHVHQGHLGQGQTKSTGRQIWNIHRVEMSGCGTPATFTYWFIAKTLAAVDLA